MAGKPYNFAKISVRPPTKREIDVLAAMQQRPVYELVAEMVAAWKAANITATLPEHEQGAPVSGKEAA